MLRKLSRPTRRRTLMIGAWSLTIIIAAAASATAGSMITGKQIQNGSVTGIDVKNGSLGYGDLSNGARTRLINRAVYKAKKMGDKPGSANAAAPGAAGAKGATGATGAQGPKGDTGAALSLAADFSALDVNVAKIGGPFADNATTAGTFTLGAGTYVVNGNAFFARKATVIKPTSPAMVLALRGPIPAGGKWGADYGTGFTGLFPPSGKIEQTTSTSRVVTLTEPTTITVSVFGYNNDRSGDGGGDYSANVTVNALKIG
jgi:hypothetical protein